MCTSGGRRTHSLACLTLLVVWVWPARGAAQERASENVHWRAVREYQQKLSLAAEGFGVAPNLALLAQWDELEAEQRRLFELARQLDERQRGFDARAAGLRREGQALEAERLRLERDDAALMRERDQWQTEQAQLASEVEAVSLARDRLASALASTDDPSSLGEKVAAFNERHADLERRLGASAGRAQAWNASQARLLGRVQDREQRRLAFNPRREEHLAEWEAFEARERAEYTQPLEAWEGRLVRFKQLQAQEARRIEDAARQAPARGAAPDLSPPQPRLEGGGPAAAWLSATTLAEASVDALSLTGRVVSNPATKVIGLAPWGAATIVTSKALYDGLKGAERAEERRLRADLERLRRLPDVIRALDAYARRLEERVQAGDGTRAEKRRLLGERARALVAKLPGSHPDDGDRLVANVFSPEAGYALVTSVGSWAVGRAAGRALAPLPGEAAPRAFARLLGSEAQGVAATSAFFALGVKKTAKKTADVVHETTAAEPPTLSATPNP